jgi:CubicO group peptidase (beta-lactamase class C family)
MRWLIRIVKVLAWSVVAAVVGLGFWLAASPPELLRVGTGYAAKIVCSNVFLAGRDAGEVMEVDVQAPGNPLLRLMRVSVDAQRRNVRVAFMGLFAASNAVYRDGLGCAVTADGRIAPAMGSPSVIAAEADPSAVWPEGPEIESDQAVMSVLSDAALAGPGMRAMVVVKAGRIVAETYGAGFSNTTPLLGWSMTKTVNAAIIGTLLKDNRLSLDDSNLLPEWQGDPRRDIRFADLLSMESGLAFNENYGTVADVTRMLYLEGDMAKFVAGKPAAGPPGSQFTYSSGTPVLLAKIWMDRLKDGALAQVYPRRALFAPLGMRSAVMETDAAGTFVAGSYMYATARDWARFGLLLARDGVWNGTRLLPEGFVGLMPEPNAHSGGRYSKMQTWLPRRDGTGIPQDAFYMQGHDGQTIGVIPSLDLVVVRLGLTPSWNRYNPSLLIAAVAKATATKN